MSVRMVAGKTHLRHATQEIVRRGQQFFASEVEAKKYERTLPHLAAAVVESEPGVEADSEGEAGEAETPKPAIRRRRK